MLQEPDFCQIKAMYSYFFLLRKITIGTYVVLRFNFKTYFVKERPLRQINEIKMNILRYIV